METKKQVNRYCIVAPLVGAADLGVYYPLKQFMSVDVSKGVSFVCAGIAGYLFTKYWVFCEQKTHYPEMGRYMIAGLVLLGCNVLINRTTLNFFPSAVLSALIIASAITTILSFVLKKYWVFKTERLTSRA